MEITPESAFLIAICTIVVVAILAYFWNKKLERDRQNLKRKQVAASLYDEVFALQGRLKRLLDKNHNLSIGGFLKSIPIYFAGGLSYQVQSDTLPFSKELNDNLSKLYTHIFFLEDFRRRVTSEHSINPGQTSRELEELPVVKTVFDEASAMIEPILAMLEKEKAGDCLKD